MVFFSSMFKFFVGLALGAVYQFPAWLTAILIVLGMMTSVILFTSFLGEFFHRWVMKTFFKNQKLFTKSNRRKVSIWKKYGLAGVAFLTPILFTPIGGAMIANGFGESKEKIFTYMLVSAITWALASTYLVEFIRMIPSFF